MSNSSCFVTPRVVPVLALAGAMILGGCAKHAPEAKAPAAPPAATASPSDADALAQTERQIANDLTLIAALALIQASNALLPATAVAGGGPMATEANAAPQPALTALPATAADGIAPAEAEVWPRVILPPEPVAEVVPVVVNNYYVQQVVAPEPAAEVAPPPPAQIVVVGGGRIGLAARGTRGPAAPAASAPAATTAPLSTGSMVATGLPLNTGSMVARGSGLTAPGTTGLLPPALPVPVQPAPNPPARGNRAGQ